jgi:hypothetical protein
MAGIGELAKDDELPGVALGVLGDMREEDAEGRFEALTADEAGGIEVRGGLGEGGRGGVGAFEGGEEFGLGGAGEVFGFEECELGFVEGFAAGVGEKAVDGAGEVAKLEADGGFFEGLGPEPDVVEGGGPVADFVERLFEGAAEEAGDGREIRKAAGEPGFHGFRLTHGGGISLGYSRARFFIFNNFWVIP